MESTLTKRQVKIFGPKPIAGWGRNAFITAKVRYDDECGNGHNTFAITGEIYRTDKRLRDNGPQACGCLHEEIAKHFPELAPLIKWHLCNSDGPWGYLENTVYLAGDRDCWGLRKGEFKQFKDKETGLPLWELDATYDDFGAFGKRRNPASAEKPAPVSFDWKPYGRTGEGKERELDKARNAAIWPEATDEELTAPDLKERLLERLPALMEEFRKAVESLGFTY